MTVMSRRTLLWTAGMGLVGAALAQRAGAAVPVLQGGCCLTAPVAQLGLRTEALAASGDEHEVKLYPSSGDRVLDKFLGKGLARLATSFQIQPGFGFYDDSDAPNALATKDTLVEGTWGTVLMGMTLFRRRLAEGHDDGMTVIAVCAHEFGHIHQMRAGYHAQLARLDRTTKPIELHADFLAGYFLGLRKQEVPELNLQGVGAAYERLGDTHFGARQHHGTSAERIASIEAGYAFGHEGRRDIAAAANAGAQFIQRFL